MALPLEHLKKMSLDNCLLGYDSEKFLSLTESLCQKIADYPPQNILLSEPDPIRFLASFIAACSSNHHIFLANPAWSSSEWQQVFELVKPDIVWGNCEYAQQYNISSHNQRLPENQTNSLIMIPTGGSSGKIRFAMHTWQTLISSVQGFREYFQVTEVNSICVLPLYHVSGLMQFMRSFTSGGKLLVLPFKELKTGKFCHFDPTDFFISLVPTQLQYLLNESNLTTWLSRCQTVLLGGAPAWSDLFAKARFHHIKLAPSYGMTETASQIATLKPESFLSGKNSSYQILPHAKVKICNAAGEFLSSQQIGQIAIESSSLALGYYPESFPKAGIFYPDDLGFLDAEANLNIVGRSSNKIITGGENVFPTEIEAAIISTNLVTDVAVIGADDSYWGQVIAAIYVPANANISCKQIQEIIASKLTRFKLPKLWIQINIMPRNEQGKINLQQLQELVNRHKALDLAEGNTKKYILPN